jgi:hypothetical protein
MRKDQEFSWKEWQKNGINIIHNIVNERGEFLALNVIKDKYKVKCDVLKYNTLKDAIPREWRKILKTKNIQNDTICFNDPIQIKIGNNNKRIDKITNKDVYKVFIKNIQIKPIINDKLQQRYGIENHELPNIFTMSKVLRDTKMRTFQYKILFNLIPCNQYLNKIGKSDTDKCAYCGNLDDTAHYFFTCDALNLFWQKFCAWWTYVSSEILIIDERDVMIGCFGKTQYYLSLNACIMLVKWHIYKNRLDEQNIIFFKYLQDLRYHLKIEKSIAARQGKTTQYNNSWSFIEDKLTIV